MGTVGRTEDRKVQTGTSEHFRSLSEIAQEAQGKITAASKPADVKDAQKKLRKSAEHDKHTDNPSIQRLLALDLQDAKNRQTFIQWLDLVAKRQPLPAVEAAQTDQATAEKPVLAGAGAAAS